MIAEPVHVPFTEWRQPAPPEARVAGQERGWQAPGEASTELELPAGDRRALRALAPVPLAGAADGARRRRAGRRAAGLARRHVPERRRARRLLARGRDRGASAGTPRGDRARRRARAASPAPSTPAAWSGSATSPPRRSPGRGRWRSPTPAATTSTTTPTRSGVRGLMPHFGTPDEAPSPVLGGETAERAPETAKLVFIGGTGRSGTHVLSQLISRHNRYALVPVEVRFHTDPEGFPGLLAGEVTPEAVPEADARLLVEGLSDQPLPRHVPVRRPRPLRRRPRRASSATTATTSKAACRRLFYDLLWFRVEEQDRALALVEQSTDNVARAATLTEVFPEARFIHVVRDGRDASASRVVPDPRAGPPAHPGPGDRVVGAADPGDRAGRGRDRRRPPAHRQPRRARAHGARPVGAAAAVPLPRRADDQAHPPLLLEPDDGRGSEQGALAGRDLRAQGGAARRRSTTRRSRASRPTGCAARRCCATRSSAATIGSNRWSTSTIVGPDDPARPQPRGARRARLRRRHRPQRHPHPLLPARPPLALPRGADRVPLPLQPEGARRRRPRPHRAGGVPAQAARLLVAPGADRRPRLRAGEVAGARPRPRPRPAHDRSHPTASRKRSDGSRRLTPTTCSRRRGRSSTTCCSPAPRRPASRSWSR